MVPFEWVRQLARGEVIASNDCVDEFFICGFSLPVFPPQLAPRFYLKAPLLSNRWLFPKN
jgi:hypothetical protein